MSKTSELTHLFASLSSSFQPARVDQFSTGLDTAKYPRYGSRRIWALLRGEGFEVNRKRIERLWKLEGHRVPPQRPSRQKKNLGSRENASWNLAASQTEPDLVL